MYEKLVSDARDGLKPVLAAVDINARAMEKLVQHQASYMVDLMKANVDHGRALAQSADLQAALETQTSFTRNLGQKLADATRDNVAVMVEARDALSKVFEGTPAKPKTKVRTASKPGASKAA